MQSGDVLHTLNRHWVRLVGRRHDLQLWNPDTRLGPMMCKRKYPDKLDDSKGEGWIKTLFEPVRLKYLASVMVFMKNGFYNSGVARLQGMIPEDGKKSLYDIILIRASQSVHVYCVVEHGRRFYRSLVYASKPQECMHDLPLRVMLEDSRGPYLGARAAWEAGTPPPFPHLSVCPVPRVRVLIFVYVLPLCPHR